MPVRRTADPVHVQYVWDSIKGCTQHKQVADTQRLAKSIQRLANCSQLQAELYIKQTLDDGLILEVKKIAQKGSHVGNEVESYKINKQEDLQTPVDDGYDWYCIECHLAGDVNACRKCHRVFHEECSKKASRKQTIFPKPVVLSVAAPAMPSPAVTPTPEQTSTPIPDANESTSERANNGDATLNSPSSLNQSETGAANVSIEKVGNEETESEERSKPAEEPITKKPNSDDYIYDETLCSTCNLNECDPGSGLDLEEFNYLLNFILIRIKSWVPEHLTSNLNTLPKYEWHTPSEMSWRAGQLFYLHMDMAAVELKIRTKDYTNFSQFQGDVVTMLHNIAIFHGVESQEYGAAEFMIRDMDYDIAELQNCVDCYRHSNEKFNNKWFCFPCRKPHKLVYAKQKGYPYWPAKVIKETDSSADVRFFGGKYERAVLPNNCIKPITTSMSQLQIKKTAGFNKAMEEMKLHQSLLDNPGEAARIKSIVVIKPKSAKKPKPRKTESPRALNTSSRTPLAKRSNASTSSMSDDVYEFHDSPPTEPNGKDKETPRPPAAAGTAGGAPGAAAGAAAAAGVKRKISYHEEGGSDPKNKKMASLSPKGPIPPPKTTKGRETDVINISDIDDEREGFHEFNDPTQNLVSSSTELLRDDESGMQKLDQQYCDAVEKLRRKLEQCKNNKQLIVAAMDSMQAEIDRIQNDHNETLKRLFDAHNAQISETKKKQWCFNCEQDAIYHCCWNTAYCSPTCQQQHWQAEHKKVCRRKR